MPTMRVDEIIKEFMGERMDAELDSILGTAIDLIMNGDLVPEEERTNAVIDLVRHLEKQETEWKSNNDTKGRIPPAYRTMRLFLNAKDLLKIYLRKLIEESKPDQAGREKWIDSHKRIFLPESDAEQPPGFRQKEPHHRIILSISHALKWALKGVPEIIEKVFKIDIFSVSDEIIERFIPKGGCTTMLIVSGVYVALVAASNLCCVLFRGRSWKRAIKNVIDEGGTLLAGNISEYAAGVTAGLVFTSLSAGSILGISAVVGLAVGWAVRSYLEEWTLKWFGLPRDEKLEKAYNLLEVKPTDSNAIVNRAYRQKSKRCHPDKVSARVPMPSKTDVYEAVELFLKYQDAIKIIRDAREKDGDGVDNQDELEICWREKVINFLKRLNPWWNTADKNLAELLSLTYDFPPISIFEDESVELEAQ